MARRVRENVIYNDQAAGLIDRQKVTTGAMFREVQLRSTAEQIAGDSLYYKNHYYPGGKEIFPHSLRMHTVDKYFPYAEGGPLFIDEVLRTDDQSLFKEKTEKMRVLGHRYVAILPGMSELDIRERLA